MYTDNQNESRRQVNQAMVLSKNKVETSLVLIN